MELTAFFSKRVKAIARMFIKTILIMHIQTIIYFAIKQKRYSRNLSKVMHIHGGKWDCMSFKENRRDKHGNCINIQVITKTKLKGK